MAAPKIKTATEKEAVFAEVAKLDRRGYSQPRIAQLVGVSQPRVSMMLKELRQKYAKTQMAATADSVAEKLEQFREARAELWEAWEKSKKDHERRVEEYGRPREGKEGDGKPELKVPRPKPEKGKKGTPLPGSIEDSLERFKLIVTAEGRLPQSTYMSLILQTLQAECELLMLTKREGINLSVGIGSVDWAKVLVEVAAAKAEAAHPPIHLLPLVTPAVVTDSPPAAGKMEVPPRPKLTPEELTARINALSNGDGKPKE